MPSTYRDVAEHMTFGASTPIRFGVEMTNAPASWHITSVPWRQPLAGGRPDAIGFSMTTGSNNDYPIIAYGGSSDICAFRPGGSGGRVINGYKVYFNDADGPAACAPDAAGLWVSVDASGADPVISPRTVFEHLQSLGTVPSRWTTRPIQ
jgi:hypothetical protein